MEDYRIDLDVYHGPLDLLLYLIKRHEVDIHDIPIAPITEQYLAYVQNLRNLDINLAGEFVVMAATLMEIKSVMMIPHEAGEGEDLDAITSADDPEDPRYELVQQLLAYKRFKDAATALDRRRMEFDARFPRQPAPFEKEVTDTQEVEVDLDDASVWDLLESFNRLMEQVGYPEKMELEYDDTPIELHADDIVDRLQRDGAMTLQAMFEGRGRGEPLGLFLALLELLRQRKVRARQDRIAGEIRLEVRPRDEWQDLAKEDAAAPIKYDPQNPDHFDWPDEKTKQRYARRIERRLRGEFVEEDAELDEDIAELEKADAPASGSDDVDADPEH